MGSPRQVLGVRGSRRGGFLARLPPPHYAGGQSGDGIQGWQVRWGPAATQPSSQPQAKSGQQVLHARGCQTSSSHPGALTELRCLEKMPGQPVLGPVLPPRSHKTQPNRGLSSFILQSGLSRDEHRLLEMLEGSPCVSWGVKPRLREGPGQPSCADRSEAAPRVTCCPGRGSPDSGSLRLSLGFPRGCSPQLSEQMNTSGHRVADRWAPRAAGSGCGPGTPPALAWGQGGTHKHALQLKTVWLSPAKANPSRHTCHLHKLPSSPSTLGSCHPQGLHTDQSQLAAP